MSQVLRCESPIRILNELITENEVKKSSIRCTVQQKKLTVQQKKHTKTQISELLLGQEKLQTVS